MIDRRTLLTLAAAGAALAGCAAAAEPAGAPPPAAPPAPGADLEEATIAELSARMHRGELSAGEALGHPLRHALISYLGRPSPVQHAASTAPVQLRPGARGCGRGR